MEDVVRGVLARHAGLAVDVSEMDRNASLFAAGMTSQASVTVMLGLEDELDVEFPDRLLRKSTFTSIAAIVEALNDLESDRV